MAIFTFGSSLYRVFSYAVVSSPSKNTEPEMSIKDYISIEENLISRTSGSGSSFVGCLIVISFEFGSVLARRSDSIDKEYVTPG